jgi:hypothetical protein
MASPRHTSVNPAMPRVSVRTPSRKPRACIFIGMFYVESSCHFTDVSFSANIQHDTRACVAGFHVWLLLRIRLYRFPRPIRTTNFLTFYLSELHEYQCETPILLVVQLSVAIILTGMNLIWECCLCNARQLKTDGNTSVFCDLQQCFLVFLVSRTLTKSN